MRTTYPHRHRCVALGGAIGLTLVLTACGGEAESAEVEEPTTVTETVTRTVKETVTVSETPESTPEPTPAAAAEPEDEENEQTETGSGSSTSFGGGTLLVGSDIQPGTYRNGDSSNYCYWERLSGTSGDFEELIANEFTEDPAIVTIAPTDVAFSSTDCGTWEMVQ
ncbi:MAG: hypothetical protein ACTH1D_11500 [Mycobacteriaceae bacterium]|uniref:hypothetical protein n=1 Tax=Corynebacterium sp. TaxID=1720 RepID=UPI003F97BDC1